MQVKHQKIDDKYFFLPDFCHPQSVLLVVLSAELLAVIFTLVNYQPQTTLWGSLGFYSISVQIVTLISIAALCLLSSVLVQFSDWVAGLFSLLIILCVTTLFSLAVIHWYWLAPVDLSSLSQRHLLLRNLLISGLIGIVALRYFYLQFQYRKQLSLEASARLEALQARIRPHFLFNSMNVIASLTRIDPAKAEKAIEDLSDLFRATLNNQQELITFSEELANSERYLTIEKLRLGERLTIEKNIDEVALTILVPPLSLQPLLENAVYHGIQMLEEGGCISLSAKIQNELLVVSVVNPRTSHINHNYSPHQGSGIALGNISQRLEVIYAGKAKLQRKSDKNSYRVTMHIPLKINHSMKLVAGVNNESTNS